MHDMKLPAKFVKDGLEMAKDARLFGVPVLELSRDELIAAAMQGWKAEQRARDDKFLSMSRMLFLTPNT